MPEDATITRSGGDDGFFGFVKSVGKGLAEGLEPTFSKLTEDVLPTWTARQFQEQLGDQLQRSTYDWTQSQRRVDSPTQQPEAQPQQTFFDRAFSNIQLTGSTLLLMIGAFAATLWLLKRR